MLRLASLFAFGIVGLCRMNAAPAAAFIRYADTPGAVASPTYTLTIDGQPVFVEKFKDVSYARFAVAGPVEVEVKVASATAGKFTLSPRSYGCALAQDGGTLRFRLDRPHKLILHGQGVAEKLFLFADGPEVNAPKPGDPGVTNLRDFITDDTGRTLQTKQLQAAIDAVSAHGGGVLFVPNGKYLTGTFAMRKGVTLYLDSGALIQGSDRLDDYNDNGSLSFYNATGKVLPRKGALVYFDKSDGAHIAGHGTLAMSGTKIKAQTGQKIRICNMVDCHDAGISDIVLRDSGEFNIHLLHSRNITMRGYKIVNDLTLPNEDGTDPDGCDGVLVDDVFMYTSDDAIAVKADFQLCQNVTVKNCVFWTRKSALKVGSDPRHGARNIVFQNNDVVHADRALALYTNQGFIDGVKFINDRSEFVGGDAKRQLMVFQVSNAKEDLPPIDGRRIGFIRNVEVINYTAFQRSPNSSMIAGVTGKDGVVHTVANVRFENLVIAGKHCHSFADANIITTPKGSSRATATVENVRFD